MTGDLLHMFYVFEDGFRRSDIKKLLNELLEVGCATTCDGRTDVCEYQAGDFKEFPKTTGTKTAITEIASAREGGIEFWYKDLRFDFDINLDSHIISWAPHFAIKIWSSQFRSYEEGDNSDVTDRVLQFLEIARPLAEVTDPRYAYGLISNDVAEKVRIAKHDLKEGRVRQIFWINVFSKPIIAQICEDRLLSAPTWKVEKLGTGSILLVVNDYPRAYEDEATEIAQYLGINQE